MWRCADNISTDSIVQAGLRSPFKASTDDYLQLHLKIMPSFFQSCVDKEREVGMLIVSPLYHSPSPKDKSTFNISNHFLMRFLQSSQILYTSILVPAGSKSSSWSIFFIKTFMP